MFRQPMPRGCKVFVSPRVPHINDGGPLLRLIDARERALDSLKQLMKAQSQKKPVEVPTPKLIEKSLSEQALHLEYKRLTIDESR